MTRMFRRRLSMHGMSVFLAVGILAGCAQIPTSGPVRTGVPIPEPGNVGSQISGPIGGDVPRGIVQGFLNAQRLGFSDEFAVARQFLTETAVEEWNPQSRIAVMPEFTTLKPQDQPDGLLSVVIPVVATIDGKGRYVQAPAGTESHISFELERVKGEWRISKLENGIALTAPSIQTLFRSTSLYFLSSDDTQLVPEQRWFPVKNQATSAMAALLEGPSAWLRDAVHTKIPSSTRLALESVRPVNTSGELSVELGADLLAAAPSDYPYIQAQIEATLIQQIPEVKTVRIIVDGAVLDPERIDPALTRNPDVGTVSVVVANGVLSTITANTVRPVDGVAPLGNLRIDSLAADLLRQRFYAVSTDTLYELKTDGSAPQQLLVGTNLTAPSVDRYGCVWSTSQVSTGQLTVVCADGIVFVRAEETVNRLLDDVRVSRDGSRLALVTRDSRGTESTTLELAGIKRDGHGTPVSIGSLQAFGAAIADVEVLRWLDDVRVVALAKDDHDELQAIIIPTSGPPQPLAKAEGVSNVASGKGQRSIVLHTSKDTLLGSAGDLWTQIATGITAVAFPG